MTKHLRSVFAAIRHNPKAAFLIGAFVALCVWVYWPALATMGDKWAHSPEYSHGYLVPVFSLVLLGLRRSYLKGVTFQCNARGLALILAGAAGYAAGAYLYFDWLAAASLVPTLAGLFWLFGGWPALRWAWPALAFLLFMIPLPYSIEISLAHPLRRAATLGSAWVLQTLGLPAFAEGNTILLNSGRIDVVEACSGLSMLLVFLALATAVAIVIRRPLVDKIVILVSAVPIAVVANIVRISANGVALEVWGKDVADRLFHDQAGWLMMPLALGLLWFELWVMSRLFVDARGPTLMPSGLPVPETGFDSSFPRPPQPDGNTVRTIQSVPI